MSKPNVFLVLNDSMLDVTPHCSLFEDLCDINQVRIIVTSDNNETTVDDNDDGQRVLSNHFAIYQGVKKELMQSMIGLLYLKISALPIFTTSLSKQQLR